MWRQADEIFTRWKPLDSVERRKQWRIEEAALLVVICFPAWVVWNHPNYRPASAFPPTYPPRRGGAVGAPSHCECEEWRSNKIFHNNWARLYSRLLKSQSQTAVLLWPRQEKNNNLASGFATLGWNFPRNVYHSDIETIFGAARQKATIFTECLFFLGGRNSWPKIKAFICWGQLLALAGGRMFENRANFKIGF